MARKIFRHSIILILSVCLIHIVACGHELDADYEGDWTAVEDEIEYRLGDVDLKPVEEFEVEESDSWHDGTDDDDDL